jgi:fructose-1,6-bisphosphatase I
MPIGPANVTTIERHLLEQQQKFPDASGVFTSLMYDLALIAKIIARETTHASLADILGKVGRSNVQGEEQQKLDVFAHNTIIKMMSSTGRVCLMASEESKDPIQIPDDYPKGRYVLLFDPLDGSSNIDYGISVGSVFSIYRRITPDRFEAGLRDLLQPGINQVAAGYVVYGSSTILVYTAGHGVYGFTLDPTLGEFLLTHENICIPSLPAYYSINHGHSSYWSEGVKRYIEKLTSPKNDNQKSLSLRYLGSLVSDFHRTLLSGGIFMYPADNREPDIRYGKLRLCYECAPLAFIAEQAGGVASDGVRPISSIEPVELHQRVPFFVGNKELVIDLEQQIKKHDHEWVDAYIAQTNVQIANKY